MICGIATANADAGAQGGQAIRAEDFPLSCTGDVCAGDVILFEEAVFGGSYRKPRYVGMRRIAARVIRERYGEHKQQHTFTLEVLASDGDYPLAPGSAIRRKGRNVYRNGTVRQTWADESTRAGALVDKHLRGAAARAAREMRRQAEPWR